MSNGNVKAGQVNSFYGVIQGILDSEAWRDVCFPGASGIRFGRLLKNLELI